MMLGVESGKYAAFGALNKHVLKPVLMEINALAPFNLSVLPVKEGKKVSQLRISWWNKNRDKMDAAAPPEAELSWTSNARLRGSIMESLDEQRVPGEAE